MVWNFALLLVVLKWHGSEGVKPAVPFDDLKKKIKKNRQSNVSNRQSRKRIVNRKYIS